MAKYLHIQVDNPCHENWNDMHPSAAGNFCKSCQKTVIDFTAMSDNQLMEFFKNKRSNVCGRFYEDQLKTPLPLPVRRIPWLRYFFQISLPALLFSYKASAQRILKKYKAPVELHENKSYHPLSLEKDFIVSGTITNVKGEPVSFASVMIKGTEQGVVADSNGVFTLTLEGGNRFIEVTAVGYEKKMLRVTSSHANIELSVALGENITLESVTVQGMITHKSCSFQQIVMGGAMSSVSYYSTSEIKKIVPVKEDISLQVFPNPAKRNSNITIQFKQPVVNDLVLVLYNVSGQRLLQETVSTKGGLTQAQLKLDVAAAGYYTLHIIDTKTHTKQIAKLIVE